MAGNLLDLNEAAKQLGVTPEELIEMRSRGDIRGFREGASWKFKTEEIERVLAERSGGDALGLDDLDLAPADSGADSILLEEGPSEGPGRSTIIGQQGGKSAKDSDLKLKSADPFDDLELAPASGLNLTPPNKPAAPAAGDSLAGDSLGLAGSEYILSDDDSAAKSGGKPGSKSDSALAADDSLSLGDSILDDPRGSAGAPSSDLQLGDSLSAGDSISLDDEPRVGGAAGTGSHGSGRMLSSGDSGINLRPGDSGLSLEEEPLDLGGSVVESLELPEDSDVVALEEDSADPDQATQLKQDDQFLLSPSDELSEEESDSGSQVIALDDSLSLDGEAATMLGAKGQAAAGGQPDFAAAGGADYAALGMGSAAGMALGMGGGQPVYVPVEVEEIPYSIWNVLGLLLVTFTMAMCAMLMADVVLNLWIWNEQTSASLFLMNNILSTFGLDK